MPVIAVFAAALELRTAGWHVMRIVETDQPPPVGRMQRKRVGQAMWSVRARGYPRNLELEPLSFLEMMNATVERQQKLEPVIWRAMIHIMC